MKFPYDLSEQRQSLLSKEDRRQYLIEHSEFYSYTEKQKALKEYQKALLERQGYYLEEIEEDEEYHELSESEKKQMAKELSLYESSVYLDDISDVFEEFVGDALSESEYSEIKSIIMNELLSDDIMENSINEDIIAPGKDMSWWIPNCGWIGKLAGGLLTGAFGVMVGLLMAGKDRAAMKALEKAMNKLVEKTDDGVLKKKTLFGRLFAKFGKRDYTGDQSKSCFRLIQENFSKQVACDAMVLTKELGFLPDDWSSAANDIESNKFNNGGMQIFLNNIGWPVANLSTQLHKTTNNNK